LQNLPKPTDGKIFETVTTLENTRKWFNNNSAFFLLLHTG